MIKSKAKVSYNPIILSIFRLSSCAISKLRTLITFGFQQCMLWAFPAGTYVYAAQRTYQNSSTIIHALTAMFCVLHPFSVKATACNM